MSDESVQVMFSIGAGTSAPVYTSTETSGPIWIPSDTLTVREFIPDSVETTVQTFSPGSPATVAVAVPLFTVAVSVEEAGIGSPPIVRTGIVKETIAERAPLTGVASSPVTAAGEEGTISVAEIFMFLTEIPYCSGSDAVWKPM